MTLYGHFDGIAGEKTEVETKTVQRETTCTFTNTGNAEGVINPNYEVEVKAREGVSGTAIRTIWELPCDGMDRLEQREYSVVRLG